MHKKNKLVSISGSSGCGKSTLLNSIKNNRTDVTIVQRKTSRSILQDWNTTLANVNSDPELFIKFQHEMLTRKYKDDMEAVNNTDNTVFTERTYADLFAFSLIILGHNNKYSNWITEYYHHCKECQESYTHIFTLPCGKFEIEDDAVRPFNIYFNRMFNNLIEEYTNIFKGLEQLIVPIHVTDLTERTILVLNTIDS